MITKAVKIFLMFAIFVIQSSIIFAEQTESEAQTQIPVQPKNYKIADRYILKGTVGSEATTIFLTIFSDIELDTSESEESSNTFYVEAQYYYNKEKILMSLSGDGWQKFITLKGSEGELTGEFDQATKTFKGNFLNTLKNRIDVFNFTTSNLPISHLKIFDVDYSSDDFSLKYFTIPTSTDSSNIFAKNKHSVSNINVMIENDIAIKNKNSVDIKLVADEYDYHKTYYYHGGFSCEYVDGDIISIIDFHKAYAGGQEKSEQIIPYIYSIKTGKLLNKNLDSLFNNKNNKTLLAMFQSKAQEILNKDYKNASVDFSSFKISENFYIDIDKIHFVYNAHELMGINDTTCIISFGFNELQAFIYKLSPLYYLFQ